MVVRLFIFVEKSIHSFVKIQSMIGTTFSTYQPPCFRLNKTSLRLLEKTSMKQDLINLAGACSIWDSLHSGFIVSLSQTSASFMCREKRTSSTYRFVKPKTIIRPAKQYEKSGSLIAFRALPVIQVRRSYYVDNPIVREERFLRLPSQYFLELLSSVSKFTNFQRNRTLLHYSRNGEQLLDSWLSASMLG